MTAKRPKFLTSYWAAIGENIEARGWIAVVPAWLIIGAILGAAAAYFISPLFWKLDFWDVSVVVYIGILTVNGLILTLSWNAFSRIYESICQPVFCSYLLARNLLNGYIFYMGYIHLTQLLAIAMSSSGLILILCDIPNKLYSQIVFAAMIATTFYAIKTAANAVTVMHDLVWQKAIFDDDQTSRDGKVVKFDREVS